MATEKQTEANRRNAQKRTGPRTSEGRKTSSRNSLKFGIHISDAALYEDPESAAEVERTFDEYLNAYQPAFPHQRDCLEEIAICRVLLRRLLRTGTGILNDARERVLLDEVYTTPDGKPIRRFDLANFPPAEHRMISGVHLGLAWTRVQGAMESISRQESRIAARLRRAEARFDDLFKDKLAELAAAEAAQLQPEPEPAPAPVESQPEAPPPAPEQPPMQNEPNSGVSPVVATPLSPNTPPSAPTPKPAASQNRIPDTPDKEIA